MRTAAFSVGRRTFTIQLSISPSRRQIATPARLPGPTADFPVSESDRGRLHATRSIIVNFWEALSVSQRAAFRAAAQERTFAAGATLMQEGGQADHVVVILRGRTKICIHDNGQEIVIAERGPGQLIGERAALRVGVRSATVIAQEMVWALAMTTEDFAAFVTAYPSILNIVESQVYDRLTQTPARYELNQPLRLNGENCTVLLTDVVGFGADARTDDDRLFIRKATSDMTQEILGSLWSECHCEDRGDGLLIIAPPHITTTAMMECINRLPHELRRHNHTYGDTLKVQIRVAVDVGPVVSDSIGVSGKAIICAARLLEAPKLKETINAANASLGVIASNFVYSTAVRQIKDSMAPDSYCQIQLNVKEADTTAWMWLTGKVALTFSVSADGRSRFSKRSILHAPFCH